MAGGGPLESVIINNRRFSIDGEANVMISLSGFINEAKPNGDGTYRIVKNAKTGKAKGVPLVIDNDRGDMEFLQDVINSPNPVPFSATLVDGTVYEGNATITGDPEMSTKEGTMEVEIQGNINRQGA